MTPGMPDMMTRACFATCRALGRLIRGARYSKARFVYKDGELRVRKRRAFYAPVLIWLGEPLMRILNTGVRVLPQRDWVARERHVYGTVYGKAVRMAGDGALLLPALGGNTLAALLQDPRTDVRRRNKAILCAVAALMELHRVGLTHGDAMAHNVLVDVDAAAARWIDFETEHDSRRSMAWRRADDVRALLATCLVETPAEERPEVLNLILDCCADEEVSRLVAASFASVWQRPLVFHLGQASLSLECFRAIGRCMTDRTYMEDTCPEIGFEPGCC
jgi:hypothetical protein